MHTSVLQVGSRVRAQGGIANEVKGQGECNLTSSLTVTFSLFLLPPPKEKKKKICVSSSLYVCMNLRLYLIPHSAVKTRKRRATKGYNVTSKHERRTEKVERKSPRSRLPDTFPRPHSCYKKIQNFILAPLRSLTTYNNPVGPGGTSVRKRPLAPHFASAGSKVISLKSPWIEWLVVHNEPEGTSIEREIYDLFTVSNPLVYTVQRFRHYL